MNMTSVVNPFGGIATHAAFQLMTKNQQLLVKGTVNN
jgi:hypothetical protein